MATPLYSTDIIPLTSRPTLTVMDDGDYFVILDTSTGKISKILRTDVQKALNISYNNTTSGLTAETVQSAIDEIVSNLSDTDDALDTLKGAGYTEGSLKTHEDRLDTLEGADTIEGSVAKTVKDAVDTVSTELFTVKVKTTENDLAIQAIQRDQTLANQSEAKISVSDYGIVALPKNATGNLKMKREGLTATNLVKNGDFSDGTTGWSPTNSIHTVSSNVLSNIGNGMNKQPLESFSFTTQPSVYFGFARVRVTNSDCLNIRFRLASGYGDITISNPVVNTWYTLFRLYTQPEIGSINNISHEYADAATANGKVMEIDGNYGVSLINLTSIFGAGNEPTEAQCKNIFPTYFADTKNVPMTGRYRGTNADETEFHDLYLTAPDGRSVPSAKDSVEVVDGRLVHVKRVWEAPITGDLAFSFDSTDNSTYTIVQIDKTVFSPTMPTGVISHRIVTDDILFLPTIPSGTVGRAVWNGNLLFIIVPYVNGNATDANTYFTAHTGKFYGVLATPITTPIDSEGSLPAGRSVYWEPAIPDVGIYTDKFDILDTSHPIASIDKLYKVDFETGVQTQLTDAVIAGDGLSFTSASLTAGDLVNVIYFYSVANPEGLTTVTYLNSILVSIDTVTGKAYTHKMKITNGIIQPLADWTLTEVV